MRPLSRGLFSVYDFRHLIWAFAPGYH